ncbi:MAG: serine/threonine protein kinase [Scytonema hyalinum WJT4-NPBG1]|jgi:serine/threonine-protein kinase|nr:serine/threonine protein kinase [Scytonema hyalinum WJT4-NPBG1]
MNSLPTPDSWIGHSIGDNQRYRLDKRLGVGGMGDVFLAMDTRLGQLVALKLLKDTLVASKEMRKRFEREVEVCAALQSDHIVKVTDCGVTKEGFPFYVMEYLRGQTLRQLLLREKRLSVERTVGILSQVCKGLQLAHKGVTLWRNGANQSEHIQVVHRDLKPDNIFLVSTDSEELVKIVDFGIAKIRNESSEQTNLTSTFLGTFRYAAPEQLKGEINLDGRADIYSLGIILYEMLSSADPFGFSIKARSISEASWVFAHTAEPPTPLRSQPGCEQLSPELEAVVMRCLQKEPDKRFAIVEELNQALQAAANSLLSGVGESTLEETIAQLPVSQAEGSYEETISRPLQPTTQAKHEGTIAQIPSSLNSAAQAKREETIAQIPSSSNSTAQAKREETIAQIPSSLNSAAQAKHEETIAQPRKKPLLTRILPFSILLTFGIIAIWLVGMGGIYAYRQFQISKVLGEIRTLKAKGNYEECIAKSEQDPSFYQEVQAILNECRLEYAKKLAAEGKIEEAINTAKKIPKNSSRHMEAQKYVKEWSEL